MGKSKQWLLDEIRASFVSEPHGSQEGTSMTPDRFTAVIEATLQIADDGGLSTEAQTADLGGEDHRGNARIPDLMKKGRHDER